jgi:hypothetical protein
MNSSGNGAGSCLGRFGGIISLHAYGQKDCPLLEIRPAWRPVGTRSPDKGQKNTNLKEAGFRFELHFSLVPFSFVTSPCVLLFA